VATQGPAKCSGGLPQELILRVDAGSGRFIRTPKSRPRAPPGAESANAPEREEAPYPECLMRRRAHDAELRAATCETYRDNMLWFRLRQRIAARFGPAARSWALSSFEASRITTTSDSQGRLPRSRPSEALEGAVLTPGRLNRSALGNWRPLRSWLTRASPFRSRHLLLFGHAGPSRL
jgi:hypothetical protein